VRKHRIEYDFYDRNQTCKLIVDSTGEAVRVVVVTQARLYAQSFPESVCRLQRDVVTVEGSLFSPYAVQCDLSVDGLRLEGALTLGEGMQMPMSFGTVAGLRVSRYSLDVPCVRACVNGFLTVGGVRWEKAYATVQVYDGEQAGFPHTSVTAIGEKSALFLTVGTNSTMGARWDYARACFLTPERSYILGSPTRVTEITQGVKELCCELKTPAVTLSLKLDGYTCATDADGTAVCDCARATVSLASAFGNALTGSFSIPAVMTTHTARACGVVEKAKEKSEQAPSQERLADCSQD